MLAKKFRLPLAKKTTGFRRLYSSPYFLIKLSENSEGYNRFGIIVPASAVRKSARRHFWKRQITECFRRWPNFKKDFLVIVSPKIESADKKIIKLELERAEKALSNQINQSLNY